MRGGGVLRSGERKQKASLGGERGGGYGGMVRGEGGGYGAVEEGVLTGGMMTPSK